MPADVESDGHSGQEITSGIRKHYTQQASMQIKFLRLLGQHAQTVRKTNASNVQMVRRKGHFRM
jgi:hypothetical protein